MLQYCVVRSMLYLYSLHILTVVTRVVETTQNLLRNGRSEKFIVQSLQADVHLQFLEHAKCTTLSTSQESDSSIILHTSINTTINATVKGTNSFSHQSYM